MNYLHTLKSQLEQDLTRGMNEVKNKPMGYMLRYPRKQGDCGELSQARGWLSKGVLFTDARE